MTEERKTVRVRIAVAVAETGAWYAKGWLNERGPCDDDEIAANVRAHVKGCAKRVTFIEADVPLPQAETVEGRVTT